MKEYKFIVSMEVKIEAFNEQDAQEVVADCLTDLDCMGAEVTALSIKLARS